jgi:hypothetical protein
MVADFPELAPPLPSGATHVRSAPASGRATPMVALPDPARHGENL